VRYLLASRWLLLGLLVISVSINYVDRGNLSVAAQQLQRELRLTPGDQGFLFSAFFWGYAICLPMAGWLIDRFRVTRVYTIGYSLWSVATLCTGLATGMWSLFLLRVVLGAGESVAYPAYSKIISASFREEERGRANAWIDAGSKVGPAIGVFAGALMLERLGWRSMFFAIGVASLLWLVPWVISLRHLDMRHEAVDVGGDVAADTPSFREILSRRSAWGTLIGLFCGNSVWYFLLTWLPPYLMSERHYTPRMLALYGSLPFAGVAVASLGGGWLSDWLIRRGADPSKVRRSFAGIGMLFGVLLVPAQLVKDPIVSMLFLVAACLAFGLFSSNVWAITQTLAGVRAAGKWTGIQNAFGNLAGIAIPRATGQIIERTGSYLLAFEMVAALAVVGALCYFLFIGPIREVNWPENSTS
jgi:MFS family permease